MIILDAISKASSSIVGAVTGASRRQSSTDAIDATIISSVKSESESKSKGKRKSESDNKGGSQNSSNDDAEQEDDDDEEEREEEEGEGDEEHDEEGEEEEKVSSSENDDFSSENSDDNSTEINDFEFVHNVCDISSENYGKSDRQSSHNHSTRSLISAFPFTPTQFTKEKERGSPSILSESSLFSSQMSYADDEDVVMKKSKSRSRSDEYENVIYILYQEQVQRCLFLALV